MNIAIYVQRFRVRSNFVDAVFGTRFYPIKAKKIIRLQFLHFLRMFICIIDLFYIFRHYCIVSLCV